MSYLDKVSLTFQVMWPLIVGFAVLSFGWIILSEFKLPYTFVLGVLHLMIVGSIFVPAIIHQINKVDQKIINMRKNRASD